MRQAAQNRKNKIPKAANRESVTTRLPEAKRLCAHLGFDSWRIHNHTTVLPPMA